MSIVKKKTKSELVNTVHEKLLAKNDAIAKEEVQDTVQYVIDELKDALCKGYTIELRGLGVFEFRYRKPKENARNPKTGKKVLVPGHTVVAFRAGKELRDAVWDKEYGKDL